ncbi:uncharacterized protein MYCFIDRAFT_185262 [Pseudocercospora fijiensis CIRAD86]|uniref:RNA polymerase II degradation factor 1 n=1 Tax=Pseudocercospora fijiensis (strain CIRAD86) TaxID=383855 RepID=N1QA75_PSEFD|nr:uncharacterized protein MYCFIDRAFT_185262 [Pseudocercospora fijiensis CIRAD86]EME88671.1 hypothetical protein MYCFIDRAFT_185262 [Pseudocercospora fijiensis CIRAD86]
MSELPTRGRSSTRGGRAGLSRGGPRASRKPNGTSNDAASLGHSLEDQGEVGQLKKKYANQIAMLKDMFGADWTDTDLALVLNDDNGDTSAVAEKIISGAVTPFAEVKKPKDRARSKVPEEATTAGATDKSGFGTRGARGRGGFEGARGGRGRGSDRGRGGHRGGRGGHATTNGTSTTKDGEPASVPTTESTAWDTSATTEAATGGWDDNAAPKAAAKTAATPAAPNPAPALDVTTSSAAQGASDKMPWSALFIKKPEPAPAPVPPKQILTKPPPAAELPGESGEPAAELPVDPPVMEEKKEIVPEEPETAAPAIEEPASEPAIEATPDPLTEENVEHLPDASIPPATQTAASTAGSVDPRNLTPLPTQPAPIGRPPISGYAAAANRLAGTGGRSASFQRRVQEQQEAVVMPGHNAMDRTALQFGSMGLNGEPDPDVDEEREEPETRQAPQSKPPSPARLPLLGSQGQQPQRRRIDSLALKALRSDANPLPVGSPPSQPRTSLPPAPQVAQQPILQENSTPKQAPGLPPASAQNQQQIQDGALGQSQPETVSQFNNSHHGQQPQHPAGFGLSSAPSDYSQYYTADQRNAYNQYYGNSYSQESRPQASQPQGHDPIGPQRSTSGFGAGPNDSAFGTQGQPQGQAIGQSQSRFAEAPGSGNNTPNPVLAQQQSVPTSQAQQHSMHAAQGHHQGGYSSSFPYGHPNYNSPYQQAYANQFYGGNQFGGYGGAGGGYQGKQGGMHGAPYGYGMGSQSSYDHYSSSPGNTGAFGQNQQTSMRSASGMGSALGGIDDYGRSSAQSGSHQQSSAYGGMSNDPFARTASAYGSQGNYGQQNVGGGQEDTLKSYDTSKSGPSPALGQPGRPGSAANSGVNNTQSGLPPPQGQQSAFGGSYPGFGGQGSQYGGLGGLGGHGQGQGHSNQFGGYGRGMYNQYGSQQGGWGQNYTH